MSGPLPDVLRPLARPFAGAYGWAVARRNARYDRGQGVERVSVPVISVGNITVGGTGKSPMVAWIARRLMAERLEPVIVMRGYAAKPGEESDEQAEYRWVLPDPHVIADPDRAKSLRDFLPAHPDVRCVLLDDGFQHRRLARDLDLVLIDATAGTLADELLPAGWLREPLENLARADAVIVTRAERVDEALAAGIERYHGKPPLAWARHAWIGLLVCPEVSDCQRSIPSPAAFAGEGEGGGAHRDRSIGEAPRLSPSPPPQPSPAKAAGEGVIPTDWLRGKRVLTMLGIANPQAMINQLEAAGASVAVNVPAGDHERYDRAKVATARGLAAACDAMVVTRKDWVKLRALIDWKAWPVPIIVPNLEMEIFAGERALAERVLAAASQPI